MASSNVNENATPSKACRCGEAERNIWTTRSGESSEKQSQKCSNCQILKSGPLFISSKGIGWTSWKKRWFVLTRTSLVFYRTDPNAVLQKGNEANPTLGGIDLNNSGSIVVKADKKLLTVLFPDGRDGRAFTLKAETSEELNDWKAALENALAQAPSAALVMGQNAIFRNEIVDSAETSFEQWRDRRPVKSLVVGRPILLALEDIDGSPSFLEKALRFIEEYGIKVEGIFRQSADVEEVERRVQEYEQGKNEFSSDEDAHVIGDCIKHVLRELPSSPVPASCCTALVEAYRTERGARLNALRAAISETFPEPNRRLVQRILKMMRIVASHKSQNRMSLSALAACMAPLLLRALLAGDCELENDFSMGGDGSLQLLQAAAAANHAQAIVIILLEEYEKIFDDELLEDGSVSSEIYTESEAEDYDMEDDEFTDNDILEDDGYHDAQNDMDADVEDDPECSSSGSPSETGSDVETDLSEDKVTDEHSTESTSPKDHEFVETTRTSSSTTPASTLKDDITQKPSSTTNILITQEAGPKTDGVLQKENSDNNSLAASSYDAHESTANVTSASPVQAEDVIQASPIQKRASQKASSISNLSEKSKEPMSGGKRPTVLGRTPARKNLSMESIDYCGEDEIAIQRLEKAKSDLETKFREEVDGNSILQASLERRKETLHEHRLALEKDVELLQEQLQKERDLRTFLESGLMNMRPGQLSATSHVDSKIRADLEEITLAEADIDNLKQKVADLRELLNHQLQSKFSTLCEPCSRYIHKRLQEKDETEKNQHNDVDSSLLINQNGNSSNSGAVLSGVGCENAQAQTHDLPSSSKRETPEKNSPKSTSQRFTSSAEPVILPTMFSAKDKLGLNAIFQADSEHTQPHIQDSHSLPKEGSDSISAKSTTVVSGSANFTSKDEKSISEAAYKNADAYSQDLAYATERQVFKKSQSAVEQPTAVPDGVSKNTSNGVNTKLGADPENLKAQTQHSLPSADRQPSQKKLPNTTNLDSKRSLRINSVSHIEETTSVGQNTATKKSSTKGENVKKESQDSPLSPSRQSSQKQPPTTSNISPGKPTGTSEETATVTRSTASRRPSRGEETATTSSALTRLTNRLNFLKERRVQLVNELQNLDINRTSPPEGSSTTNSK